ncbi:MAG: cbb3-type cytochrome c oxidase N-terminal domain-containing protein [Bacteroidota bacterium]
MRAIESGRVKWRHLLLQVVFLLITASAFAEETPGPDDFHSSMYSKSLFISLLVAAIFLLILILVLVAMLKSIMHFKNEKEKIKSNNGGKAAGIIVLLFLSANVHALSVPAESGVTGSDWSVDGIDPVIFYSLVAFLIFETAVALFFLNQIRVLLWEYRSKPAGVVSEKKTLMDKFNASVSLEKEKDILLDHNYDGIRELDNSLPPWWKYMFYATCIWGLIYLIHYHLLKTGSLQLQEYENEMAEGQRQVEEYNKRAANNVDENSVTMLTDETSLNEGKNIYTEFCVACHGNSGEGGIGPNLTDDYWIHGGSVKDVFKSVKYGWPEKGMKSWQQELNPKKIHQVTSYILSLRGTNPSGAKAPQGELYIPEENISDTLQNPVDTLIREADTIK